MKSATALLVPNGPASVAAANPRERANELPKEKGNGSGHVIVVSGTAVVNPAHPLSRRVWPL